MVKKAQTTRKPRQIRLTENALQNIDEITGYIAFINHQPLNAVKVGDRIFETLDRIQKNPYGFKECELMITKTGMYRQANCSRWLIIYKISNLEIVVLGIIDGSRKPSAIKALRKEK